MGVNSPPAAERISKFKETELRYGAPMALILQNLYQKFTSQSRIAHELGISQSTLSVWVMRCGLAQKTILVPISELEKGA